MCYQEVESKLDKEGREDKVELMDEKSKEDSLHCHNEAENNCSGGTRVGGLETQKE